MLYFIPINIYISVHRYNWLWWDTPTPLNCLHATLLINRCICFFLSYLSVISQPSQVSIVCSPVLLCPLFFISIFIASALPPFLWSLVSSTLSPCWEEDQPVLAFPFFSFLSWKIGPLCSSHLSCLATCQSNKSQAHGCRLYYSLGSVFSFI